MSLFAYVNFWILLFYAFRMAYAKMNKHKEAEAAYKDALRLEPDNADYQNNLSVTQQRISESTITFRTRKRQILILCFSF